MSVVPTLIFSPIHAEADSGMKDTTRPRTRRRGSFVLAIAAGAALASCSGITIGPVDHSCPVVNSCQHAGGR